LRQYLVIQVSKINLPLIQIITTIVCINLLRSGERIGSLTHWQPTKSPPQADWKTGANSYSDEKQRKIN